MISYPHTASYVVYLINNLGNLGTLGAQNNYGVYPVVYLKADITLSGDGTKDNPYMVN